MNHMREKIRHFLVSEDGPTAVEYAVMLALIIVVCVAAIQSVGGNVSDMYNDIRDDISAARNGTTN